MTKHDMTIKPRIQLLSRFIVKSAYLSAYKIITPPSNVSFSLSFIRFGILESFSKMSKLHQKTLFVILMLKRRQQKQKRWHLFLQLFLLSSVGLFGSFCCPSNDILHWCFLALKELLHQHLLKEDKQHTCISRLIT